MKRKEELKKREDKDETRYTSAIDSLNGDGYGVVFGYF